MRTGRTLTIFRCLVPGGVYPQRKQKSKKIPCKSPPYKKKIGDPPEKLETPWKIGDPSWKIGDPPKNWSPPLGLTCKACWDNHPPGTDRQGMLGFPPWTEWMTDRCKNITLAKTSFRPVKSSIHACSSCPQCKGAPWPWGDVVRQNRWKYVFQILPVFRCNIAW